MKNAHHEPLAGWQMDADNVRGDVGWSRCQRLFIVASDGSYGRTAQLNRDTWLLPIDTSDHILEVPTN
jgi:hypothetical protein